jgi:hypothetical protein
MWRLPSKRQVRQAVLALLLPALMFRAAIPAGYMPVSANGQLSLVMCSAVDITAGGITGAATDRHNPDNARGNGPCHFAASSALAPLPESGWSAWLDIPTDFITRPDALEGRIPAVVRAQSPRGPPAS